MKKLLIANRGEIACRINKTAQELGIQTVAVYSAADRNAPHTQQCDESYPIGLAATSDSYLNIDKIIEVARAATVDAIHPGYGFLAENPDFAKACADNNIIFVGPSTDALINMADKVRAKEIMQQAKVPIAPFFIYQNENASKVSKAVAKIGYPVIVKPTAGGGGKGMRLVETADELMNAIAGAQREAKKSFADDRVFIEKYLANARHIEVQVFADQQGNTIHLFERDCSCQRRHQKIIEEALAANISESLRSKITKAAVQAAKAINYVGAGTVEFLLAPDDEFYFMEMNTRLQVEHPVTEMITGVDLVAWQLKIASGEKLPLKQSEIQTSGHAIEVRLYAEDPNNNFLPSTGKIDTYEVPNVRIDSGVTSGSQVSRFYDPMLAKLIVHASDRSVAITKLQQALCQTYITGVKTNIELLYQICQQEKFQKGLIDTQFIDQHLADLLPPQDEPSHELIISAMLMQLQHIQTKALQLQSTSPDPNSPWLLRDNWRTGQQNKFVIHLWHKQQEYIAQCELQAENFHIEFNNQAYSVQAKWQAHQLTLTGTNVDFSATVILDASGIHVFKDAAHYVFANTSQHRRLSEHSGKQGDLTSPMPGTVIDVLVKPGQEVLAGERLMILEAMKMEHTLTAPKDGTIKAIHFKVGDALSEGVELIEFQQ